MKEATLIGGRYRLQSMLAEGGMGEVWRAHDELLGRDVAVKVLRTALTSDPVVAERFRREARAAASLSHPNMANVYDYIEEETHPGIVMELVDGQTLSDVIAREAPMELERAAGIIDQVLAALEAAHGAGVVHRDMKPANVMIDRRETVKVADFGIARALGESTLTETGTVLGSVHYVSPEQLHGGAVQPASDVYATGVMLYEMLAGVRPFEAETPIAVAMSRLQNDPAPARSHRNDIPRLVEAVIMRALARKPADRYATAAQMRAALREAVRLAQEEIRTLPLEVAPSPTMKMPTATDVAATTRLPAQDNAETTVLRTTPPVVLKPKKRLAVVRPALLGVALGLITLALVALVLRPPPKVTVPVIRGHFLADAQKLAGAKGLTVHVTQEVDSRSDLNVILSQTPAPGTILHKGDTINVIVSNGNAPCCTVPQLSGMTRNEAADALRQAGLELGEVSFRVSENDAGEVISQTPAADQALAPGEKVAIVIATQPEEKGKGKGHD